LDATPTTTGAAFLFSLSDETPTTTGWVFPPRATTRLWALLVATPITTGRGLRGCVPFSLASPEFLLNVLTDVFAPLISSTRVSGGASFAARRVLDFRKFVRAAALVDPFS
jgi:hypothetical protein